MSGTRDEQQLIMVVAMLAKYGQSDSGMSDIIDVCHHRRTSLYDNFAVRDDKLLADSLKHIQLGLFLDRVPIVFTYIFI